MCARASCARCAPSSAARRSRTRARTTTLPEVDPVAYFLIRRGDREVTVLNGKVPVDLEPLTHRLNAIFDAGRARLDSSYFVLS